MENAAGEQRLALRQLFLYVPVHYLNFFKVQSIIKSHFFNDGILKLGYFDIFNMLFLCTSGIC